VAGLQIKIEWTHVERRWHQLPSIDRRILWGALVFSLLLHFLSWIGTGWVEQRRPHAPIATVKIRNVSSDEKKLLERMKNESAQAKRILETPLTPTEAPKLPSRAGAQDHATKRETKLSKKMLNNSKAMEAGSQPGDKQNKSISSERKPQSVIAPQIFTGPGTMLFGPRKEKPRNTYERLLPDKSADVFSKPKGGYMEHIDNDIAEGDRIDMNTTSFRYISYFSGLRKQIELVWIYPSDAIQRGLQGAVQLEMIIEKDGRVSKVRVVQSSGYSTLDDNMLKTIKLASPFAPLPKGWGKERLVVTGSFHYVLSYAGH
jgi:TonB family protein